MARRRALAAGAVVDAWTIDPLVTAPVLRRVENELAALLADRAMTRSAATAGSVGKAVAAELSRSARTPRRARRLLAAGLIIVLVAVVAVVTLTLQRGSAQPPTRSVVAPSRQDVVVLALARNGQVSGVSLLASGVGASQQVLVPSRLVLDVPGAGQVPLTQALAAQPSAVGSAVADALDIRVDATWVLDTVALAALIDEIGGVVVDVDVDVTKGSDAAAALLVGAGHGQRLSGTQAAAYAQLIVGDEPEASRLARQEVVLGAALGALPKVTAQRRALIAGLTGAPEGTALDAVVATTGGLREEAAAHRLASTLLPVHDIDSGADVPSYGLDAAAAADLVRSRLAGAALPVPSGGRTRVLVQNGVGTPGLGDAARSRLVAAGLRYVGGGNIGGFGVQQSVVLLPDRSASSRARGKAVVAALGLTDAALRITDSAPTVADLVVVLGADFQAP